MNRGTGHGVVLHHHYFLHLFTFAPFLYFPMKMDEDAAVNYTVPCCLLVKPLHCHHDIQSVHIYFHPRVHADDFSNCSATGLSCAALHQKLHLSHLFIFGDELHHYWHAGCCWSLSYTAVSAAKVHRMLGDNTVARLLCCRLPLVSDECHKPRCLSAIGPFSLMFAMAIAFHNMSTSAHV